MKKLFILILLFTCNMAMADQYQENYGTVFAQSPYKNRTKAPEISCNIQDYMKKPDTQKFVEFVYKCDTVPKLKQLDFDGAYENLSYIWKDYDSGVKGIDVTLYDITKWESHSMLSLAKFGRTFFNEQEFERVYALTLVPGQTEKYMTDFYKYFNKYSRTRQEGYVLDCIVLGEYMLKNGMLQDQRKADLYISYMLYLLRVYDERPQALVSHINHMSKLIIKQGSRWTHADIKLYVKQQLQEKYNRRN